MRPDIKSRGLLAITRSKARMYEFDVPAELHIEVPAGVDPEELFLLTVGMLGDVAATVNEATDLNSFARVSPEEINFSASFFDAFVRSRFASRLDRDTIILAASAYYLARLPGNSLLLARGLADEPNDTAVLKFLRWLLTAEWKARPTLGAHRYLGSGLDDLGTLIINHFASGSGVDEIIGNVKELRSRAYRAASPHELLLIDVIASITKLRISASAWTNLPRFSGVETQAWRGTIAREAFPKELWPSQLLLGEAGIFAGASGVVQMPTSAGKTRAVEMILRSAFLSDRTRLAVVVAPFRALCHEIGTALRTAFRGDDVKVNELSDAMQLDFLQEVAELFGTDPPTSRYVLVLTPEKLLYVLRQAPTILGRLGLIVYDEGHQFDSGSRGITYELLLTEIKALTRARAQTILISAVITNAQAVGEWLIGDNARVVDGIGLLPMPRSVAFASWRDRLGRLTFFDSSNYRRDDYFVPRVIEATELKKANRERKARYFPERGNSRDIALYLGFRVVSRGAVALFCGRKDSASAIAERAVEAYTRGFALAPPATYANQEELQRLLHLIQTHFGKESTLFRAGELGIFVHHGATPRGLRLAIEDAMQRAYVGFVICTSTLAQGVNLPIRYLIVASVQQGSERIKVRDFQNLIGRAGRSGMHTEGVVVFADPTLLDARQSSRESWRFWGAVELLSPERSELTTSTLLNLLAPIQTSDRKGRLDLSVSELCDLLLESEGAWAQWAEDVVRANPTFKFKAANLISELRSRRQLIFAIESYLMAHRANSTLDEFEFAAEQLASSTLAYHLAADDVREALRTLFRRTAQFVSTRESSEVKQAQYGKTLLGVSSAKAIDTWVNQHRDEISVLHNNDSWLRAAWPLFVEHGTHRFFHSLQPEDLIFELTRQWLDGVSYAGLNEYVESRDATKPRGESRTKITSDDVVDFCENGLSFDCSLILAAVGQFLFGDELHALEQAQPLIRFQKSLKYGIRDSLAISAFDLGFADRAIAQELSDALIADEFLGIEFKDALADHSGPVIKLLREFPAYYQSVFSSLVR
jgi:POLQ-like helicase